MKKTLYIIGLIFILATTAGYGQSHQADSLLNVIEQATEQLRAELAVDPEPAVPVTDLQAAFISKNIMKVSWTPGYSGKIDVHYYAPHTHREWQHSVATYKDSIEIEAGGVEIGVARQAGWLVKASRPGWESEVIEVQPYQQSEQKPAPVTGELIPIHEINEPGDPLANIAGVVEESGIVKVYVNQRNGQPPVIFQSDNMRDWEAVGESDLPHGVGLFQGSNGRLHGWQAEGDGLNLLLGSRLHNNLGRAYDWKIDGAVTMHETADGRFRAFGRVRGNNAPKSAGGWGGDVPAYPEGEFQDRRGISYHMNDTWESGWEKNRILADPADYFAGYHKKDVDPVPDFYESFFLPDGRGFVTVFWKSKSRRVDRRHLEPNIPESRRYRLTGEVYPVPAVYKDSELLLLPDTNVIPRSFHEREPLPDFPYTGPAGKKEIGEIYIGGIVHRNGHVYIFYKWRGGLHYEGHDRYPSGIYAYRVCEGEFDALFN